VSLDLREIEVIVSQTLICEDPMRLEVGPQVAAEGHISEEIREEPETLSPFWVSGIGGVRIPHNGSPNIAKLDAHFGAKVVVTSCEVNSCLALVPMG
jgi:hypothetical protein